MDEKSDVAQNNSRPSLVKQFKSVQKSQGTLVTLSLVYRFLGTKVFGIQFYQQPICDCLISYAQKYPTFIDVGAHTGTIINSVAKHFSNSLAIEPHPQNVVQLKKSIQLNKISNCQVIAKALGSQEGEATLFFSDAETDQSSLAKQGGSKEVRVPVTTFDLIIEQTKVSEPFLIKIDVQGWEFFVFEGAKQTLMKDCIIISEFWPWGIASVGCKPAEYVELMKNYGYTACELKGNPIPVDKLNHICEVGQTDRLVVIDILFKRE
jgi:FkbM family methyltransferase